MYNSEEEFLAHYDPSNYDRLSLTTDILVVNHLKQSTQASY